jgi:hypothetical protein
MRYYTDSWKYISNTQVEGDYWYNFDGTTLTVKNFKGDCNFKFVLLVEDNEKDSETFTLKSITSDVDYNFFITQTTINSTNGSDNQDNNKIQIAVQKRSKDGVNSAITAPDEEGLTVYRNSVADENIVTDWVSGVTYVKGQTDSIKLILKQDEILWDEETIEFVQNGAKGDTGSSPYTLALSSEVDSVAITNDGDCVSTMPIEVTARAFYG